MTRLELRLANLRREYQQDIFHLDLRQARARRIGRFETHARYNAWDRVREIEAQKAERLRRFKDDVASCYRDNKRR